MVDQALWTIKSSGRALILVSFIAASGVGGLAVAGEWVGVLVFAGLMVLWLWLVTSHSRSMSRAARDFAQTLNWSFQVRGAPVRSYKTSLRPFDQLDAGRVGLLVSGKWGGLPAESFVLQGPAGESREQVWVALLRLPRRLPTLELLPTKAVSKSSSIGRDVEVESAEFNSRWRVKSPDLRFGHAMVHPRMVERLLRADADYSLGIDGDLILVSTRGASTWNSGRQLLDAFTLLADVVELIPDHVWRAYAEGSRELDAATHEVFTARPKHNGFATRAFFWAFVPLFSAVGIFWGHRALRAVNAGTATNRKFAHFALAFAYLTTLGLIALAAYSVVMSPAATG